ncbi:PTS system mannose/fructose/sorbose family transporter subunit IID [Parafannyhessea umbonata]|uniref:PTS system mannose/fructose/sorbose family transporter subunit IID n=1 Tax=Parafannyhessea umbonata TaxID=604330 RepID=A0A6N7X782_9ACTN|nr:PTS system mannose/fructose/sorbose family transporter subunit IID [Parafannyhessea umbonata]MST60456.1 PTS system mannose/fructose/sorbose family transporter subunit IID [Parafannyhessea umbonata]
MAEKKKISQSTLKKSFRNWAYGNLTCFSQEHMQTFGYLAAMLPVVDELYDNDEDKVKSLRTYTTFFNTEPQIGTLVVGLTAGLEEARANGEPLDDETINGIRAGLMGPLAGLGDSIIVGTFIPILLGIALGLSTGGSVLGPLFYIVAWNVAMYFGMKYAYNQGYTMGGAAVEALVGPQSAALRSSIVMVGTMVIGAVAATWINITTALQVTFTKDSAFVLQDTLDGIFPKALNFFFVWLCWWLMTKKKISPTVVMLILVGIAFVGVLVGFFDPKLKY